MNMVIFTFDYSLKTWKEWSNKLGIRFLII